MSADGRFVAFRSWSFRNGQVVWRVFLRDLWRSKTTLVSRADGADGRAGNFFSWRPSVSADGRFVAFESSASNLTEDDTDRDPDVFVRDTVRGRTTLVSRASGAHSAAGNRNSYAPSISANGRFVAFSSHSTNLSRDDHDRVGDVYLRDLARAKTTLVSRASGNHGSKGNKTSSHPTVSADGRFVAFASRASNLSPDDTVHDLDVFVRDVRGAPHRARTPLGPRAATRIR